MGRWLWKQNVKPSPGWMLRCPVCGRSGDAGRSVWSRLCARSAGKERLGYCRSCRRLRMLSVYRGGDDLPDVERDETWRELAAYVAMGTMDAETAQRIVASPAPEPRKREVAAYVAEGMMVGDEAVRLLNVTEPAAAPA